jgi:hypothetical protein
LAVASAFVFESFIDPAAVRSHLFEGLEIGAEALIGQCTILEALEIGFELPGWLGRKTVNHPGPVPRAFHQAMLAKMGELLGNLRLGDIEDFLEMADAKRTARKQMHDPQARGIAETLINPDQLHAENHGALQYIRQSIYMEYRI